MNPLVLIEAGQQAFNAFKMQQKLAAEQSIWVIWDQFELEQVENSRRNQANLKKSHVLTNRKKGALNA